MTTSPPVTLPRDASNYRLPRSVIAGGFLGFFVSGGVASLYGPAAPAFRRVFGVEEFASGLPASVHPFLAFVGVLLWAVLVRRRRAGRVMATGAAVLALGALGIVFAPSMAVVLAWVVLVGLGFGVLANAMNSVYPRDTAPHTAVTVGRMHGAFGVGAVLLPLVLSSGGYRVAYVLVAVLALAALPLLAATPTPPVPTTIATEAGCAGRGAVLLFSCLFGTYVATEAATAAWLATYLEGLGWSEAAGARWTSAFWTVFTLGRFAVAPLAQRVAPGRLIQWALPAAVVLLLVASVPVLAPYALVGAGLAAAPVFPTAMVWLARAAPTARNGTTAAVLSAMTGATIGPAVIGAASTAFGRGSIPFALAGLALFALLAGSLTVRRLGRG